MLTVFKPHVHKSSYHYSCNDNKCVCRKSDFSVSLTVFSFLTLMYIPIN